MREIILGQGTKNDIMEIMAWMTNIFKVMPTAAWISNKRIKFFFGFYSSNVSCFAIINDVMMNNFVIRITLQWNN